MKGACLRYMMNRNRQVRGVLKIYDKVESPMRGRVVEM